MSEATVTVSTCTVLQAVDSSGDSQTIFSFLQVMIGTNLNFTAGTLTYQAAAEPLNLALIIPVIVGPVVLVLLIGFLLICIVACVSASKVQEKDKHLITLLRMEHREIETADDCLRGEQQDNCNTYVKTSNTGVALAIEMKRLNFV